MNNTFEQTKMETSVASGDEPSMLGDPVDYVTVRSSDDLRTEFKIFQNTVLSMFESWFEKQDQKLSVQDDKLNKLLQDQEELKSSMAFINGKFEDMDKKLSVMETRIAVLEDRDKQIAQLGATIDRMDQQARQCNVEISNLPEKRNEDLIALIETYSLNIEHPITAADIVSINRVPHADPKSERPKNLVIKFSSKIVRDNFLSSAKRARGITSDLLGIHGPTHKIYAGEHLTLKNKRIFREARILAQKNGYKYVWPKNGTILVRANDTAPIFAVRTMDEVSGKITIKN